MAGDFRLAHLQDFHKIAHTNFLVGDEVEETQAGAVGQNTKKEVDRKRFRFSGHGRHYIWLDRYMQIGVVSIHALKRIYLRLVGESMKTEPMKALKAHVAIHVHDVAASIEFYRKLFGIEPCKVRVGYAKFDVANPPLNLTLNERPEAGQGALSHLGI